MTALSVIIPFYKDFPYLRQAVHSVLAQGLGNTEIIIVNDNPVEEGKAFLAGCDFPAQVRIVDHAVNRGLSASRNTGVTESKGAYIAYLDADDFYLPGGLKHTLERARETGADVTHSVTVLREEIGSTRKRHTILNRDKQMFEIDRDRVTLDTMPELQFIISSWKSLYRRDFLERTGIVFDEEQRKFEDRLYVLQTVLSGGVFCLSSMPTRVWRRRRGSITTSVKSHADLKMMADLIDKCTALVANAAAVEPSRQAVLNREIYHSVARLIWDLDLIQVVLGEDETAMTLRPILQRAIGRASLDASIFADPVVRQIDRTGIANKSGIAFSGEDVLAVARAVAAGDWAALKPKFPVAAAIAEPVKRRKPATMRRASAPADAPELILHLGLHKTGTTFLQRRFMEYRQALIARGILFPLTGFFDHEASVIKAEATPGHQGFIRAFIDRDFTLRDQLMAEIAETGARQVLISCENMSFPYLENPDRAQRSVFAADYFSGFSRRRVVATFRRPDRYFEALYRERISNPNMRETRSASEFLYEFRDRILDVEGMLAPWREFAGGALSLFDYDAFRAQPDYLLAFAEGIGLDLPDDLPPSRDKITYATPHWEAIELLRMLNATVGDANIRRQVGRGYLNGARQLAGSGTDRSLLSPIDRVDILETARRTGAGFFAEIGFGYDFDVAKGAMEREAAGWTPPGAIDYAQFEALLQAVQSAESVDSLRQAAPSRQRVGKAVVVTAVTVPEAESETAMGKNKPGFRRRLKTRVRRFVNQDGVRTRLLYIYRRLPAGMQAMARKAYNRVKT